jgi:hypothetical protein
MRAPSIVVTLLLCTVAITAQGPPPPAAEFARWEVLDADGRTMRYLGRGSLFLSGGIALMPDVQFADGMIEFDVAMHGQPGFAGVLFRGQSPDDYELIYLRTHRSRQWDALQYTPIFAGQEAWQLYTGPGYNGVAELPLNRWVHVKVAVEGRTARVFVDHAPDPQLTVTDLKRPWASGRVGLWGRSGAAHFSNVTVAPAPAASAPQPTHVAAAPGIITRWAIGPAAKPAAEPWDRLPPVTAWDEVTAESSGVLNIARYRRPVEGPRDRADVVPARTILRAAGPRRVRVTFGYSDDVTVFLNGRAVFSGRNAYLERDGSALGTLTLGLDVVVLDLTAGRNELVFAVGERFGGWGVAARLLDTDGVTVE